MLSDFLRREGQVEVLAGQGDVGDGWFGGGRHALVAERDALTGGQLGGVVAGGLEGVRFRGGSTGLRGATGVFAEEPVLLCTLFQFFALELVDALHETLVLDLVLEEGVE